MTETVAGMSSLEKAAKKSLTPAELERAAVRSWCGRPGPAVRS